METLAPGHIGSVIVDLSLNLAIVARHFLARGLTKVFNSVSGASWQSQRSYSRRTSFMFAELVGRFRKCKLSSNCAGRAGRFDDDVPRISNIFNRSSNNEAAYLPALPCRPFTLNVF